MRELKLLIVEDDPTVISGYESSIKSYNKTNGEIFINETIESDKNTALEILRDSEKSFDGAIVDLDLRKSGGEDSSGNEIVREVKNNLRFPVFVISGTSHNLDESLREESAFFKVKERDDGDFDFIEEMTSIYNTGITEILNRKGTIEKYITEIFWKHLSNSLDLWTKDGTRSPEDKQKSLLRYTLSHLHEYLEITEDSDFENYHPSEIYITPTIKPRVFTGDIVVEKSNGNQYIVLTPSCDLAQSKAKDILLVKIESSNDGIMGEKISVVKNQKGTQENRDNAENILRNIIHNNYSNKYHFLPKYKTIEGGLINFQKINSIRVRSFESEYSRIASVNGSFTKDIVARFSYYYSRQGSPDFVSDEIFSSLF
jgi:CheY-like chemotaxis protein